jgi:hypothetical protein
MRYLFVLLLLSQGSSLQCKAYNSSGTDYADPNITIIEQSGSNYQCCVSCSEYNAKKGPSQKACLIGVWYNAEKLCMLKATALLPVPRKMTVAMQPTGPVPPVPTPPTPPTPAPAGRHLYIYYK